MSPARRCGARRASTCSRARRRATTRPREPSGPVPKERVALPRGGSDRNPPCPAERRLRSARAAERAAIRLTGPRRPHRARRRAHAATRAGSGEVRVCSGRLSGWTPAWAPARAAAAPQHACSPTPPGTRTRIPRAASDPRPWGASAPPSRRSSRPSHAPSPAASSARRPTAVPGHAHPSHNRDRGQRLRRRRPDGSRCLR